MACPGTLGLKLRSRFGRRRSQDEVASHSKREARNETNESPPCRRPQLKRGPDIMIHRNACIPCTRLAQRQRQYTLRQQRPQREPAALYLIRLLRGGFAPPSTGLSLLEFSPFHFLHVLLHPFFLVARLLNPFSLQLQRLVQVLFRFGSRSLGRYDGFVLSRFGSFFCREERFRSLVLSLFRSGAKFVHADGRSPGIASGSYEYSRETPSSPFVICTITGPEHEQKYHNDPAASSTSGLCPRVVNIYELRAR